LFVILLFQSKTIMAGSMQKQNTKTKNGTIVIEALLKGIAPEFKRKRSDESYDCRRRSNK